MNQEELHSLDCKCAELLGKVRRDPEANPGECWVRASENPFDGYKRFQPTRSDADAMDVLRWVLKAIWTTENCGFEIGMKRVQDRFQVWFPDLMTSPIQQAESLNIAICLFAVMAGSKTPAPVTNP